MGLDELKDKYRTFPMSARLAMAVIIGIVPGACSYFDEVEIIESALVEAQSREDTARVKFETDRKLKANIPKLEEELVFTEGQLEQAAKKLPESYLIESILSLTASNAKQAGINLTGFKPSCELKGEADFKYVEREIDVTATGKFQQLASFFDKMVHTEVMLFLRAISIEPFKENEKTEEGGQLEVSPYQRAQLARQNLSLKASFKVVVFRAMKDEESDLFDRKENCDASQEELLPPSAAIPAAVGAGDGTGGTAPPPTAPPDAG